MFANCKSSPKQGGPGAFTELLFEFCGSAASRIPDAASERSGTLSLMRISHDEVLHAISDMEPTTFSLLAYRLGVDQTFLKMVVVREMAPDDLVNLGKHPQTGEMQISLGMAGLQRLAATA